MHQPISIRAISSISALGSNPSQVWSSYLSKKSFFSKLDSNKWVSKITSETEKEISFLKDEVHAYKNIDRTTLLAIKATRNLFVDGAFPKKNLGVNIGSSRGATQLFEKYYSQFNQNQKISAYTSPTTTLGNISSWVAQDISVDGVAIDHSVTCSTAMHALLNGIAWLKSDMADSFLVGASEAALTPFTLAQMDALKLYSKSENSLACESMRLEKMHNTMVLGEGAALAILERGVSENSLALIAGYGFASEILKHNSSISKNADCFQKSMKRALNSAKLKSVDAIIMHAPGTVKGDQAEKNAIDAIFGKQLPLLTSNKWILGHTFGASGMFSIELATMMIQQNTFIENPFFSNKRHLPNQLKTVMVNAVGFGGNAVSVILQKP